MVLLLRDRHLDTPSNTFAGGITDTSSGDRTRQLMTLTLTPTGYAVNMSSWAIIRATVTRLSSADVMTIPMAPSRALLDNLRAFFQNNARDDDGMKTNNHLCKQTIVEMGRMESMALSSGLRMSS